MRHKLEKCRRCICSRLSNAIRSARRPCKGEQLSNVTDLWPRAAVTVVCNQDPHLTPICHEKKKKKRWRNGQKKAKQWPLICQDRDFGEQLNSLDFKRGPSSASNRAEGRDILRAGYRLKVKGVTVKSSR